MTEEDQKMKETDEFIEKIFTQLPAACKYFFNIIITCEKIHLLDKEISFYQSHTKIMKFLCGLSIINLMLFIFSDYYHDNFGYLSYFLLGLSLAFMYTGYIFRKNFK